MSIQNVTLKKGLLASLRRFWPALQVGQLLNRLNQFFHQQSAGEYFSWSLKRSLA